MNEKKPRGNIEIASHPCVCRKRPLVLSGFVVCHRRPKSTAWLSWLPLVPLFLDPCTLCSFLLLALQPHQRITVRGTWYSVLTNRAGPPVVPASPTSILLYLNTYLPDMATTLQILISLHNFTQSCTDLARDSARAARKRHVCNANMFVLFAALSHLLSHDLLLIP